MECHTLTDEQFADFSGIIAGTLGIKMPASKRVMLQSRLHRRLRELELGSLAEYHDRFFHDAAYQAEEIEHLLNLATTNKTDFFREPDHFEILVRETLARWRAAKPSSTFRVWCAGCSTGEEAYTLAMTLLEEREREPFEFSILATDISTRVLQQAMSAIYRDDRIGPIPPTLRAKYLLRSRDPTAHQVRLSPAVRERVRFGQLNFLATEYGLPDPVDAVFFRNVMIYFERATQQEVVTRMCRHLRPEGDLYTSHSESLQGLALPLQSIGPSVYRHGPKTAA